MKLLAIATYLAIDGRSLARVILLAAAVFLWINIVGVRAEPAWEKLGKECTSKDTGAEVVACFDYYAQFFGRSVDEEYQEVLRKNFIDAEAEKTLIDSQTAWKTYSENWCRVRAFVKGRNESPQIKEVSEQIIYASCLINESANRVAKFQDLK